MRRYISGFDYLKALFSVLVVMWHANAIASLGETNPSLEYFERFLNYNVCLLAVPVFFTISLFLFYKKQMANSSISCKESLRGVMNLYTIWMSVGVAIGLLLSQKAYIDNLFSVRNLFLLIVTGSRPELYFLFSLLLISYLAFINKRYLLGIKHSFLIQTVLLLSSLLILMSMSFATLMTQKVEFSAYWNPMCFIPYIFSSSLLAISDNRTQVIERPSCFTKRWFLVLVLFSFFLLFSWVEWKTFNIPEIYGYLLPPYSRPSLVIGSLLAVYCAKLYRGKTPAWVRGISQESLAIYLLHNYILLVIALLTSGLENAWLLSKTIFNPITNVFLAVSISILLSRIMKRYSFGRLMLNSHSKTLMKKLT